MSEALLSYQFYQDIMPEVVRDENYERAMFKKFPAGLLIPNGVPMFVHYDLYNLGASTQPSPEGQRVFWPDYPRAVAENRPTLGQR